MKEIGLGQLKFSKGSGVLIFCEDIFEMKRLLLIFMNGGNC